MQPSAELCVVDRLTEKKAKALFLLYNKYFEEFLDCFESPL